MANKRKKPRKRPYTPPAPRGGSAAVTDEAAAEKAAAKPAAQRRQYKEEARKARERAIKRYRRRAALRRVATIVVVAIVVGGVFFFLTRVGVPKLSDEAVAAAEAAGCSQLQQETDRGGTHGDPPFVYEDRPATSGRHVGDRSTAAGIYTEPQPEEEVVHAMEHGYAVIYYRAEDPGGVSDDVLSALEDAAEDEEEVLLAPYAALPEGTAVAFAGWTHLLTCPGDIEPDQAETIAVAWIDEIRNHKAAPEANTP